MQSLYCCEIAFKFICFICNFQIYHENKKTNENACNVCAAIDFNHLNKSWNSYAMFSFIFHLLVQKNNYPFAIWYLPYAMCIRLCSMHTCAICMFGIYICSALKGNFPPSHTTTTTLLLRVKCWCISLPLAYSVLILSFSLFFFAAPI